MKERDIELDIDEEIPIRPRCPARVAGSARDRRHHGWWNMPLMCCQSAAGVLSKYDVGTDGRTGYERMKGTPCSHDSGIRLNTHYRYPTGSTRDEDVGRAVGRMVLLSDFL